MTAIPVYTSAGDAAFWRTYSLTIEAGDGSAVRFGNTEVGAANLRFAFSVERKGAGAGLGVGGSAPGPRSLVLTNLATATRDMLQINTRVVLKVGYGNALSTLLQGTVLSVYSARSGSDVTTTLDIKDGEQFSQGCVFMRTYAPSPTLASAVKTTRILRDIADTMQLTYLGKTVRIDAGIATGIKDLTYPGGLTFNGTCGDALTMLLEPQGLTWGISNGALNVIPADGYNCLPVIVMRPETGLINVPSAKTVGTTRTTVLFDSLMNTQLVPNQLVTFVPPGTIVGAGNNLSETDSLLGYYSILKTTHKGDTYGQSWDVNCEAIPYPGPPLTAIPVAAGFDYTKAVVR